MNADPRYLACSIETRSEIVVPIMLGGDVLGELDIDSDKVARVRCRRPRAARSASRRCSRRGSPNPRIDSRRCAARIMSHVITLIPGDGIGPEVTEAVVRIFKAAGLDIDWERHDAGVIAFDKTKETLPVALLDSIKRNKVALKGPVTTPIGQGFTSVNVGLRKALDLYANLRPVRNLPGVTSRYTDVDLIIVRENTEDLYAGLEHEVVPGVVESLKIITERASTNIAQFAFEYARRLRPQAGDGHPQGQHHEAQRRAVPRELPQGRARLHRHPLRRADRRRRLHAPGDAPGEARRPAAAESLRRHRLGSVRRAGRRAGRRARARTSGTDIAVFEAVHGSAPDIALKNLANPTALLLSALMMLDHIGERETSGEDPRGARHGCSIDGAVRTRDLGGTADRFTDAIHRSGMCRAGRMV